MMYSINEAFQSSIMKMLWKSPQAKISFTKAIAAVAPNLDVNAIVDSMFTKMKPQDAYKIHAKVFKFWISNRTSECTMVTYSNSWFDQYGTTDKRKRYAVIGVSREDADGWIDNGQTYVTKQAFKECYVFDPFLAITKGASRDAINRGRVAARKNATAFKSNEQIKKENIARYIQMIKNNKISDGSEFALASNLNKLIEKYMKNVTPLHMVLALCDASFIPNYMNAYINNIMKLITILDQNGYMLPVGPEDKSYKDFIKDEYSLDAMNLLNLQKNLANAYENIEKQIKYGTAKENIFSSINDIINNSPAWQEYISTCSNFGVDYNVFNTFREAIISCNNIAKIALSNKNISSNLYNLDIFVNYLLSLHNFYNNVDKQSFIICFDVVNDWKATSKFDKEQFKSNNISNKRITDYVNTVFGPKTVVNYKRFGNLIQQIAKSRNIKNL